MLDAVVRLMYKLFIETDRHMNSQITVRQHKGRSGKSVFAWRVYRETLLNGSKMHKTQLGKYRTQIEADKAAEHYRNNDERVAQLRGAVDRHSRCVI